MNEQATRKYYETIVKIDEEIESLKDNIANYNQKTGSVNWCHVGNMQHILTQLKELNNND